MFEDKYSFMASAGSEAATPPAVRPERAAFTDVLTVSPNPTLSLYLGGLFDRYGWTVVRRTRRSTAVEFLRENPTAVVLCEAELPDGGWRDVLESCAGRPGAPAFVLIGDRRSQWGEGASRDVFDVLTKPLRESDVVWSVASAWHQWTKAREKEGAGLCSDA